MTTSIYTNKKSNTKEFINKANKIHNNLYDYSMVNYVNSKTKVKIICSSHGSFLQRPNNHLSGQICPSCSKKPDILTKSIFIERSNKIHNKKYNYSSINFINSLIKIDILCKEHGSFPQLPKAHMNGQGCPLCSKGNYSKVAINWLNSIKEDIQHAENGGEYNIPSTRYKVDGYCKETNTVYEFHGDKFHGNPELFNPNDTPHPFDKSITAKELYDMTIERENEIKSLGYILVVMWENNYLLAG